MTTAPDSNSRILTYTVSNGHWRCLFYTVGHKNETRLFL